MHVMGLLAMYVFAFLSTLCQNGRSCAAEPLENHTETARGWSHTNAFAQCPFKGISVCAWTNLAAYYIASSLK